MRILYALHGYKPAWRIGGPILSVAAVAERLAAQGHEVTVVASDSNLDEDLDVPIGRPVEVQGVNVWYFRRKEPFKRCLPFFPYLSRSMGFLFSPALKKELERMVPEMDLVHTQMPFVYPTLAAARMALRFRKPLFYHQRGVFDPERLKFRRLKKMIYIKTVEAPIMRRATTLFALTDAEAASYRRLKIDTPCRIVPNGIEADQYRSSGELSGEMRAVVPPDALIVLFLSRLHQLKGVENLIRAFYRIHEKFPNSVLILAGPDESRVEARFAGDIRRQGLSNRILFPGMVTGREKTDLLARCDIFCLPSFGEGFSMAVLEAMASSKPVILSPGCHFPEVETEHAGRIVSSSPASIAGALADLLSSPETRRSMGLNGCGLVRKRFTWDRIAEETLEAYREGIERHRTAKASRRGLHE